MNFVSSDKINEWSEEFEQTKINKILQNVISANSLEEINSNRDILKNLNYVYDVQVAPKVKASNQKSTGRCWMFAALNAIRNCFIEKYELDNEFEFSQSYLFFYDKLERSNYFLESMFYLKEHGHQQLDRVLHLLTTDLISDGGQYDMFVGLVSKYGLVPKSCFQESRHSSNSAELNNVIKSMLRYYASTIWADTNVSKEEMLREVYNILLKFLGTPPSDNGHFDWIYLDKNKKYKNVIGLTPQSFYQTLVQPIYNIESQVSIIHDPRQNHSYGLTYGVEFLGSVIENRQIKHLNLSIERIKELVISSLNQNRPVWFGCDVGKSFAKSHACLDSALIKHTELLNLSCEMSKVDNLLWNHSLMTHAMLFTGYGTNCFQVENSWGVTGADSGYLKMSADWFDRYVYQIVIDINLLTDEEKEQYNKVPEMLPLWDPFGSLA